MKISPKKQIKAFKKLAGGRIQRITTNEKIAGAAALGLVIGVVSTIGSSLLYGGAAAKDGRTAKKS